MTILRRRMIEDMQVRSLSPQTQATYVQQVSLFARHFIGHGTTHKKAQNVKDVWLVLYKWIGQGCSQVGCQRHTLYQRITITSSAKVLIRPPTVWKSRNLSGGLY